MNNNKDNNNKPKVNTGEATTLSKFKIALFFFVGYFFLPIGWLLCVLSAFYQLCLVQGTLSSQARVITAVVCMFFLVAPIPFLNLGFYFSYNNVTRDDISIQINGQVPLGLLTIFYVWGSIIGYRYYTIPASYEQERDRESVRRLEQQELKPPLLVARPIARAARGIDGSYATSNMPAGMGGNSFFAGGFNNSSFGESEDTSSAPLASGSPTHKQNAPIGEMMTAEYQAKNFDNFAQFTATHRHFDPQNTMSNMTAIPSSSQHQYSPRGSMVSATSPNMNMNNNNGNGNDDIADSAADMQQQQQQQHQNNNSLHQQPMFLLTPQQQYAQFLQDKVVVRNAYDLYCLLKEETGQGAGFSLIIGFIGAALTMGTARIQEWQSNIQEGNATAAPNSNAALYNKEPVYTLSTVFFVGIFFVFYTTLAFVRHLYTQNIQLVYHLTYLARGVGDLRSDREIFDNPNGENNSNEGNDTEDSGSHVNQSMHYISAKAFSSYESTDPNSSPQQQHPREDPYNYLAPNNNVQQQQSPRGGGAGNNTGRRNGTGSLVGSNNFPSYLSSYYSTANQEVDPELIAAEKHLSAKAAKAVIVELLDPYNITHLRAWEEVRKIAAEQISLPTSVLNSFFTPTVFISAFGGFGLGLYLAVRVLFLRSDGKFGGPFFIAVTALSAIFFLYLIVVYISARETRRFFKVHETIISRIAFDVARELEHSVRRTQHGLEYLEDGDEASEPSSPSSPYSSPSTMEATHVNFTAATNNNANNNNNNNNANPNMNFLTNKQQLQMLNGKAHFFHEPPSTEQHLTSLFDSVNSLCNMMSVATPRPLFIGMEQRNVRYFLAYVLALCAVLLFFALLTSMRSGNCVDNVKDTSSNNNGASSTSSPGMLFTF